MIGIYYLFLLLPFIAHALTATFTIFKISKTPLFTKNQKRLNIILVTLIPFVWAVLVYYILKKEPDYFDKRRRISNDTLESGFPGGGDFGSGHGDGGGSHH